MAEATVASTFIVKATGLKFYSLSIIIERKRW